VGVLRKASHDSTHEATLGVDDSMMRVTHQTLSSHGINLHDTKAFLFRKALKQLRFDEGKEQSCG
jgi:hypothetical protein